MKFNKPIFFFNSLNCLNENRFLNSYVSLYLHDIFFCATSCVESVIVSWDVLKYQPFVRNNENFILKVAHTHTHRLRVIQFQIYVLLTIYLYNWLYKNHNIFAIKIKFIDRSLYVVFWSLKKKIYQQLIYNKIYIYVNMYIFIFLSLILEMYKVCTPDIFATWKIL